MDVRKVKSLNARMESGCNPDIKQLPKGQQVKNAHSTGDDDPRYRESWIDYWKAFATEDIPDVCPLCGKSMTGDDSKGCHVLIKSKSAIGDGYGEKSTSFLGIRSAIASLARSLT